MAYKDNRRRHPRRDVRWKILLRTRNKQEMDGMTVNVGAKGVLVVIPANLSVGDRVFIEIHAVINKHRRLLQSIGEVRHVVVSPDGFRTGIHLINATRQASLILKKYAEGEIH